MSASQLDLFKLDIDRAEVAVMASGARIFVYPGEGADEDCFAGELLSPTEREWRLGQHVSCMWDRSKVVALERLAPPREGDAGGGRG